jgi:ComF family protein
MKWSHAILSFFLPQACVSCRSILPQENEGPFCAACHQELKPLSDSVCTICGDPFTHEEITSHVCGRCLSDRPYFEWARSVFEWGPPLSTVIHGFKYQGKEVALRWMAREMARFLRGEKGDLPWDFLVPVPLHPFRLIRRGFNQALLLARALHREIGVPLDFQNLLRGRYERPQVAKDREERLKQIQGAFALRDPSRFEDKKVLLIDDVYTTGATLNECAKVLKTAGAQVEAFTLARTLLSYGR